MDGYPDINYHDIDGHVIVPGAWLHLIRSGTMHAYQVVRYAPWGQLWACWIRREGGRQEPLIDRDCLQASVRLRSPLQPSTFEWECLESRLLDELNSVETAHAPVHVEMLYNDR
ncbi:MAG: hypothetical protein WCF99_09055 [Chloroflexales bacterium]